MWITICFPQTLSSAAVCPLHIKSSRRFKVFINEQWLHTWLLWNIFSIFLISYFSSKRLPLTCWQFNWCGCHSFLNSYDLLLHTQQKTLHFSFESNENVVWGNLLNVSLQKTTKMVQNVALKQVYRNWINSSLFPEIHAIYQKHKNQKT